MLFLTLFVLALVITCYRMMRIFRSYGCLLYTSTLEELLRGNIAGLPEIVAPQAQDDAADVPEELAWATTDYLYDLTQEYYQVISETTTSSGGASSTTAYAYGLERIAAFTSDSRTSYVYDAVSYTHLDVYKRQVYYTNDHYATFIQVKD